MPNLLDTHTFLWYVGGDSQLSQKAKTEIEKPGAINLLSTASAWEIGIKYGLQKLALSALPEVFVPQQMALNNIIELPIGLAESCQIHSLPRHHGDPFDRLIAMQCLKRGLTLLSADTKFDFYGINRVW